MAARDLRADRSPVRSIDPKELDRIHHVAVKVRDIGEAVEWYRSVFRCRIEYQDATWALLKFSNASVALVIADEHPPHTGFVTPSAGEHGELRSHRDGTRSTYMRDPSGNTVELMLADDASGRDPDHQPK